MFWINIVQTWCVLTILLEIDYTDSNTFVNFNEMKTLLQNSKSILIDGDKIALDNWLSNVIDEEKEKNNKNSNIMYTFIKCECAVVINKLIGSIYDSITRSNYDQQINPNSDALPDKDGKTLISFLEKLNSEIKLAITTLFEIRDAYPNLRFAESYFLKTLLMTSFYIDGLTYAKKKSEDPTIDKERKDNEMKVEEELTFMKQFTEHPIDKKILKTLRSTQYTIELSEMLLNMRRVILQVMNLIDRYTIEYCDYCYTCMVDNVKNTAVLEDNGKHMFEKQLNELKYFLTNVVSLDTSSPPYKMIDMKDIMLRKCMKNSYDKNSNIYTFCNEFLRVTFITTPTKHRISMAHLYNLVEYSFDIDSIYEYIFAVYKAILVLIYRETQEIFENNKLMDIVKCEKILSKLTSMNSPFEMIDNFDFILKTIKYKELKLLFSKDINTLSNDVCKVKIDSNSNISYKKNESLTSILNISDLMDVILSNEFKQFWWVFNLLYRESQKKSNFAYDSTLVFFPEKVINSSKGKNNLKCDKLINMYNNYFYIEHKNKEDMLSENMINSKNIITFFKNIYDRNTLFANYLLYDIELWKDTHHLCADNDLQNIVMDAILHFKNEYNYYNTDTEEYQNESQKSDLKRRILQKLDKFKRIGDVIMNLLDNYQIRNCEVTKIRMFVNQNYKKNRCNEIHHVNLADSKEPNVLIGIIVNGKIIKGFYPFSDFPKMMKISTLKKYQEFADGIFFNWHGEIKSMNEIQIYLRKYMLDKYDLVEYQRLYLKWIIYIFYYSWFVVTKHIHNNNLEKSNSVGEYESKNLTVSFSQLREFNRLHFPEPYERYGTMTLINIAYFSELKTQNNDKSLLNIVKDEIILPLMKSMGVEKENDIKITNVDTFDHLTDITQAIISYVKKKIEVIDTELIALEQKLPTFNLTYHHY